MKLEYLPSGSPDCPILRLYDFTPGEASQFRAAVEALAGGAEEKVEFHRLPWVDAVAGCALTLLVREWDQGVARSDVPPHFVCGFTRGTWDNVAGLIEPFEKGSTGYQWLAGSPGEARLLLSVDGDW